VVIDSVEHGVKVSKSGVKCHIIIHDNTTPAAAKPMQRLELETAQARRQATANDSLLATT
jgi:hypothetical protein